jgi:Cys-rich four helix bundle protein (predicted Tat secretion target)
MLRRQFVAFPPAVAACGAPAPEGRHVDTSDAAPPTVPTALRANVPAPPPPPDTAQHAGTGPDESAMRVAGACVAAGQVCLQHCLGLLGAGDVKLAACARAVVDMIAVSQATQTLAAAGAPELKTQAGVAVAVLTRCEEACREHLAHHDACRDCAARCAAAIREYRRLTA